MTRPHIPDGWLAQLPFYDSTGFMGETTFGIFKGGLDFDQTTVNSIGTLVTTAITANNVDDAIGIGITMGPLTVTTFDEPNLADLQAGSSTTGSEAASDRLPYNIAALTHFSTPFAGASFRGRSYWMGYTEASSASNTMNSTSRANLQAMWNQIKAGLVTMDAASGLAVLSRKLLEATLVTSLFTEGSWATQRKRLTRRR